MNANLSFGRLRRIGTSVIAAITFVGVSQATVPAQALPLAPAGIEQSQSASEVELVRYRPYRHSNRRPFYRRGFVVRRHVGRVPVPCRGVRTHLSKRYC